MTAPVLITGATGTIGSRVDTELRSSGFPVRRAVRRPADPDDIAFDFTRKETWPAAFAGVATMFVVRPPALGNVRKDMIPALAAAREHGVEHFVLLSVQGAERLPMLPHAALERWIEASGARWTLLRPAYFHQNLTTTLAPDVRRGELRLPSGKSRMAFVDGDDVAAVAAAVLRDPARYASQGLTLTSTESPTWADVAAELTATLGRRVGYRSLGPVAWLRHARGDLGMDAAMSVVTGVIHASARFGQSARTTSVVSDLLGRPPVTLHDFVVRSRDCWN